MRDIRLKFRAFNKDANQNKMTYFDLESLCYHDYVVWETMLKHGHPIMQFTGLTDRSGKEIYEGDILKNEHGLNEIVKWMNGQCCNFCATGYNLDSEVTSNCWIAGNIYEHS